MMHWKHFNALPFIDNRISGWISRFFVPRDDWIQILRFRFRPDWTVLVADFIFHIHDPFHHRSAHFSVCSFVCWCVEYLFAYLWPFQLNVLSWKHQYPEWLVRIDEIRKCKHWSLKSGEVLQPGSFQLWCGWLTVHARWEICLVLFRALCNFARDVMTFWCIT